MAARLSAIIVTVIVGATLIAGLIVGAQRDDADGPVDLIIHNGRVYREDGTAAGPARAVAIRGNQILRVGSDREVKRLRRPQTTMVDAHGGSILPGFIDSHVSLLDRALARATVDLSGIETAAELEEALTARATAPGADRWLVGTGWRCIAPVTGSARANLDRIAPERPVYLECRDGRTSWANSRALEAGGLTKRAASPAGGSIGRDPRTGEPTGVLEGAARARVVNAMPPVTAGERLRQLRDATALAHRHGVTSVHDIDASPDSLAFYDGARRAGDLKLRVYGVLPARPGLTDGELAQLNLVREKYLDDPLLKAGAIHLVVDGFAASPPPGRAGTGGSRPADSAWTLDQQELARLIDRLDAAGWQIIAEASHEPAVGQVLDAFEQAASARPAPERPRRHRLERVETITGADAQRVKALQVMAVLRPGDGGLHERSASAARTDAAGSTDYRFPFAVLLDAKVPLIFGSDWPALPLDPLRNLLAAVAPPTADASGEPAAPPADVERAAPSVLPLSAALQAYTVNGAWASFDDHRKGRLAAGMLADVVILSKDIFTDTPSRLPDTVVSVTIFDGKVVYRRRDAESTD